MVVDGVVGDGPERLVETVGAFDAWFFANTGHPFVVAGRAVAGSSDFRFPPDRINIIASPKQRTEEGDLIGGGRVIPNGGIGRVEFCGLGQRCRNAIANLAVLHDGAQPLILEAKLRTLGFEESYAIVLRHQSVFIGIAQIETIMEQILARGVGSDC